MPKLTEEQKAKLSLAMKGNENRLGYKVTDDTKHRLSKSGRRWHRLKGHKVSKRFHKQQLA